MGKQKQKIDTLERRIRALEVSNKELIFVLKDMVDRLIKSELQEKKESDEEFLAKGLEECLNEGKTGDEKVKVSFCTEGCSEEKKEKEDQNGV